MKNLQQQWIWQARSLEKFEATPLVVDGVMYTVEAPNNIVALDAATGRPFWTFNYTPAPEGRPCCGRVNRGVAILGDTLFMATIDAHLIADRREERQAVWNIVGRQGGRSLFDDATARPIVKDKVIVGTGGGDGPIRGFIAAYDAKTGKEALELLHHSRVRANRATRPGRASRGRPAASACGTPARTIPETNMVYFGTGNPAPDWDGATRLGDNLYSDSVVALDADTGKLKWHYQFTPHDELDYDSTQVPVLADIDWQGRPRKVMLWANRNGVMYVLDRTTGEFLKGKPYVKANWLDGFDAKGRPNRVKFPTQGRHADLSARARRHQLGAARRSARAPASSTSRAGRTPARWRSRASSRRRRPRTTRQTAMGQTTLVPFFNDDTEPFGVVRAFDPKTLETEMGIQDERHHVGRHAR